MRNPGIVALCAAIGGHVSIGEHRWNDRHVVDVAQRLAGA